MFIVGFLEEVIFRGLLFKEMSKDGLVGAIIVSSLTFGIGHIINLFNGSNMDLLSNIMQIIYATSAGFMFVMVYLKTDSIIICILIHGLFNALSAFSISSNDITVEVVISLVITLITLAYGLFILFNLNKNKNDNI